MNKCILHLPKWFPNKFDPQNGVFIDKHIQAVGQSFRQTVLSVFKDRELKNRTNVNEYNKHGVTYVEVSFKPFGNKLLNVLMYAFLSFKHAYQLSKNNSIIHTHVMGRNTFIGWVVSFLRGIKLVHTEHWSLFLNEKQWKSKPRYYKVFSKFLLGKASKVLTVSEPLKDKLLQVNKHVNPEVIGNVIAVNPYPQLEKESVFTFIHISDLRDDIKNISGVIDAYVEFEKHQSAPVQLYIIGDGEDRNSLETKVKNTGTTSIYFLGRQSNENVYQFMNKAHCLILNSRIETFGMVILEAFSCGIPAICARNGVSESFIDSSCGIVVEQNDPIALVEAMQRMFQNYSIYIPAQIIEKARPFSEIVVGNKIKRTYKNIINEK